MEPTKKLPLAVRKNVRDHWNVEQPALESLISSLLDVPWTVSIDVPAVYQYAEDPGAKALLGSLIAQYITSAIDGIKALVKKYGEDGRNELNNLASNHTITLEPADDPKISYCGCDIANDSLRILFNKKYFGTNINDAFDNLDLAINAAGVSASNTQGSRQVLDFNVKAGIKADYDPIIPAVEFKAQTILALPALKFVPNFESNFAALTAHEASGSGDKLSTHWQKNLGAVTRAYFEGFVSTLESNKFGKDDMLQEGFAETVSSGQVALEVVQKLQEKTYNNCAIADGVLVLETVPAYWGTNVDDAANGLMDIL